MAGLSLSVQQSEVTDYVTFALILVILFARVSCQYFQFRRLDTVIYLVVASMTIITARFAVNHYILQYGTVSDYRKQFGTQIVQPDLHEAQTASILSLVARALITSFYWLQCTLLLLLYRRLVDHIPWVRLTIKVCWALIGLTYFAVMLTTFLECQPFHLYTQLSPDPGVCTKAYGQLILQCASNIAIDIMLLVISFPILAAQARIFPRNIQLLAIFILGTFCIIVTCLRIASVYQQDSTQYVRSFWASAQAVTAAFVANAPPIYASVIVLIYRRRAAAGGSGELESQEKAAGADAWIHGQETIKLRSVIGPEDRDYAAENQKRPQRPQSVVSDDERESAERQRDHEMSGAGRAF